MSHAFTDGLPGLEAILVWTSGHRLAPTATLNDLTPGAVSRVKLDNIDGLHGRSEIEDRRQSHLGRHGELIGPAYEPGRTVTPTGQIQAKSALELRKLEMALNEAFEERNLEGAMQVLIDDQVGTPLDYWIFTGRVISFDPDDQQQQNAQATWPYQRGFTLGIRCSDPRIYWSHAITGGPNATQVTVTNPGRDTNPLVTVNADGTGDVTIFLDTPTTGYRRLKVATGTWGSALVITFDFQRRIIWANDPGDVPFVDGQNITNLWLTAQSDWWDPGEPGVDRGSNTIRQTGGTDISVYFTPAV